VEASVAGLGGTIGAYGGFNFAREPVIQASRSPTERSRQSTIVLNMINDLAERAQPSAITSSQRWMSRHCASDAHRDGYQGIRSHGAKRFRKETLRFFAKTGRAQFLRCPT
jgi:hypothetical protein